MFADRELMEEGSTYDRITHTHAVAAVSDGVTEARVGNGMMDGRATGENDNATEARVGNPVNDGATEAR